jgi:phosphoribosylanthranilate isomerase
MRVKICGLTRLDQAKAVAGLGATDLGFICVSQSARYIGPDALAAITHRLQAEEVKVGTVGVFVDAPVFEMVQIIEHTGLKTLQLHGQESLTICQALRHYLPHTEIIKAIRIRQPQDLELAQDYSNQVDGLLLDAYHPHQYGGTGQTLDWETLKNFRPSCPWLLAGGINPENVKTAISLVAPDGIDLSSGVEDRPGIKNLDRVKDLFDQIAELPLNRSIQRG